MDPVFGSPLWNRTPLRPNNRWNVGSQFQGLPPMGYKSNEPSSVVSWRGTGKGVQGESVNSKNNAYGQVVRRSWRP